jgi:hypothetical protein
MAKRQRKGDWVVAGGKPGEIAHCTHCGDGLSVKMPIRVDLWVEITKAFVKIHKGCQPGTYTEPTPKDAVEWAAGRDTGISSMTIWSVMVGAPSIYSSYDIPHDPADFGRCYRLLKLFPEWRAKLHLVAEKYPKWKPFVECWDELSELYEEELQSGTAPQLYDLMQKLRQEK